MKNKKKRIFLKLCLLFTMAIFLIIASGFVLFFKTTKGVSLDAARLESSKKVSSLMIYDKNMNQIDLGFTSLNNYVSIDSLPSFVKNAFIVIEDKRFYKHNGVDYYRMVGAAVNNIKKGSFSQGGSTISQQLIKNTHLTREKTLNRKMKEIKLAYELENKYSKDEILEMYLNNIYFGNGCYGIEKASNYYFNKSASEMSVGEAAMLAGVINAPSIYNPINNQERSEKRKKLVLRLMKENGFILDKEYEKSANNNEKVVNKHSNYQKNYINEILNEVKDILNVSINRIKNMSINIETYIDNDVQKIVQEAFISKSILPKNSNGVEPRHAVMVVDNKTKGVIATFSSGINVLKDKRQPGSTIKPVLVYAPAFENNLLYPESIIVDEEININGYSPSNANKKFLGNVSVREALEKSLNVPAVKVLSKVGIERAKNFAKNMGLTFAGEDKNLALALGGMTEGVTIKQLADAYATFADNGNYKSSSFIKRITDENGTVLYEDNKTPTRVMDEGTAGLVTDVLKGVATKGTARRLSSLGSNIASKTGTVGLSLSSKNTDAFNISYTNDYTIVSWCGAFNENEFMDSSVNGSTYPTIISKNILKGIYNEQEIPKFSKNESLVYKYIDLKSLKNNDVKLAKENLSVSDKKLALFNKNCLPEYNENDEFFVPTLVAIMEEGEKPTLCFDSKSGYEYILFRKDIKANNISEIAIINDEEKMQKYTDKTTKTGKIYEYYLKICKKDDNNSMVSNSVKLLSF